jgi:retinitis pigmentosa 9 protein
MYNNEEERKLVLQKLEEFAVEGEVIAKHIPRPEDEIPDLPEHQAARNFLKTAPTKGLHLPLGKEVKVMQCFRCKAYGHRAGDKECALHLSGNVVLDVVRQAREDPMSVYVANKTKDKQEKYERVEQLKILVKEIREEELERKRKKLEKAERREKKHKRS